MDEMESHRVAVAKFMQRVSTFHYIMHWWIQVLFIGTPTSQGDYLKISQIIRKASWKIKKIFDRGWSFRLQCIIDYRSLVSIFFQ